MTDIPTIEALPLPPQRGQDPAVFIQRADDFIDALADFVAEMNAFGVQLVQATKERVSNEAGVSFTAAAAARDAALAARDAAQASAASVDGANIVHRTGNETVAGTKNFTGILQLAGAAIAAAATYPEASTAEALNNAASRLLSVRASWNALVPVALVDAATIALDLNAGINFSVTVAGNRVLGNPTNGKPGQQGSIFVMQDATGGRTLSFGSAYVPDDLTTFPLLNTAAGTVTELRYKIAPDGKVRLYGGRPRAPLPEQTITIIGNGNYGVLRSVIAGTFTIYCGGADGGTVNITRRNSDNTGSTAFGSIGAGQSVDVTIAAGQIIFGALNGTSAWLHIYPKQ